MEAFKCDDCGELFERKQRGDFYRIRDGVSSFVRLDIKFDLCDKCWNKMLREIQLEIKEE